MIVVEQGQVVLGDKRYKPGDYYLSVYDGRYLLTRRSKPGQVILSAGPPHKSRLYKITIHGELGEFRERFL